LATMVASSTFLFAMTSAIAHEGRIRVVFMCTTGQASQSESSVSRLTVCRYAAVCVVLTQHFEQNLRGL
jgi:hypothetical protein